MAEQLELYSHVPPPGANIPIYVEPLLVDNLVPTEDEIKKAVKLLCNHRSRVPLGMRSNHLKGWLTAARKTEKEEAEAGEETTESNRGGESTELTEASN